MLVVKNNSTVPIPTEPKTSAPMLATMNPLSTAREAMFISVPNRRKPMATRSCVPGSKGSRSNTTGTKPAAP